VEVDVVLVVLLAAGFLLGVLRGAVRQLIALGAWVIAFIVAAYLRSLVGDWIASNAPQYSREYVDMLAFLGSFLVLFTLAVLVIEIGGSTIHLTQRVAVDEVLGGLLALGFTLLSIAAVVIALDSYYAANPPTGATELDMVHQLHSALARSAIVSSMHDSLIPGLIALLGPLLPSNIPAVYR
jgi:membrane protein required for colicin V production